MTAEEAMKIINEVWREVSWSFTAPDGGVDSVVTKTDFFNKLRPALNRQQRHDAEMEGVKKRLDAAERQRDAGSLFESIFGKDRK